MQHLHEITYENVQNAPLGHCFYTAELPGGTGRFEIRRGFSGVCAYLSVPTGHPLAAEDYQPDVHGGITFSGRPHWAPDRFAWGWDHSHYGDEMIFPREVAEKLADRLRTAWDGGDSFLRGRPREKRWLPIDAYLAPLSAVEEFPRVILNSERCAALRALSGRLRRGRRPEQFDQMPARMGHRKLREPDVDRQTLRRSMRKMMGKLEKRRRTVARRHASMAVEGLLRLAVGKWSFRTSMEL